MKTSDPAKGGTASRAGAGLFGVLGRLKLWQKFALLAAIVLPATLLPAYQYYANTQEGIDFAKSEESGLGPTEQIIKLIQLTQQHRGLSAGLLAGNESLASARSDKEAELRQTIAKTDDVFKDIGNKSVQDDWAKTKTAFARIAQGMSNRTFSGPASFDAHTALVHDYTQLNDAVIDHYKLSLDPDAHTYFLIQASLVGLPALTEPFGQLRAVGTGVLAAAEERKAEGRAITDAERARVVALSTAGTRELEFVSRSLQKVFREKPELGTGKLATRLKAAEDSTKGLVELANRELLNAPALSYRSDEFFKKFTAGIDQQFDLLETSGAALKSELHGKVAGLRGRQVTGGAIIGALFAAAVLLGFAVVRSVLRPVSHLQATMESLRQGDASARAHLAGTDEIGELGRQFDTMVDEREAVAAKIKKDNDALNDSIIEILRSVAKTAQGDLTVLAPVREDVTGALSDAINSMADSTAKTLAQVTVAANEVRSASQDGRDTVHQTSRGMNDIRGTIQETAKRIKRLGERSQEITGIVKLIDDIAERTSVLALNANMQAAMAGEAGRGFRVVADEVQRLAERSKEATDQIGKLVGTIQAETNETQATMERAVGEVVKGGELADKAAEKVSHLDELGGELLESVQAFKLPDEALKQAGAAESAARDSRRAA